MNRWTTGSIILVLAVLSGATAYYATKATVLEKQLDRRPTTASPRATETPEGDISATPTATGTPTAAVSTPVTAPSVATGDRLSVPAETYEVAEGETLYPIGLKLDINWERIAEVNNLKEPYVLKIKQKLVIPTIDAGQSVYEVRFTTEPGRATTFQKTVESGSNTWRLDPVSTAKAEHGGVFGLTADDDYRLADKNDTSGTARVTVTRLVDGATKTYEITLAQPATKGSNGIWTIDRIQPKTT